MKDSNDVNGPGRREAPEGYGSVDWDTLTTEDLQGASVYDRHDREVARVRDVVLADDGRPEALVMDVGGFVGIGSHVVSIRMDRFGVRQGAEEGEVRVYLAMTGDDLRNLPEYPAPTFPPAGAGYKR